MGDGLMMSERSSVGRAFESTQAVVGIEVTFRLCFAIADENRSFANSQEQSRLVNDHCSLSANDLRATYPTHVARHLRRSVFETRETGFCRNDNVFGRISPFEQLVSPATMSARALQNASMTSALRRFAHRGDSVEKVRKTVRTAGKLQFVRFPFTFRSR